MVEKDLMKFSENLIVEKRIKGLYLYSSSNFFSLEINEKETFQNDEENLKHCVVKEFTKKGRISRISTLYDSSFYDFETVFLKIIIKRVFYGENNKHMYLEVCIYK